ncbi:hypothetical protein [Bartonella sp. 1-1C]|uniref:hypothetical protein n=1 Tax=Bartonella sp. 1-1C TaxID=515256 RepID=UPI0001F4C6B8|nr:hypothetical protein [Bartonella sp. 1-1C]CBI80824.1 hypothetical protein B11C_110435 [Bartonella sp. 1-1C]
MRNNFCNYLREVGKSGDLSLLIDTEHYCIDATLARYANSKFERFYRRLVPYF